MSDRIDTDAVLHRFMHANDLEKPGQEVDLEGPLYRATEEKQREELSLFHVALEVGKDQVKEKLIEHYLEVSRALAPTVGFVFAGTETIVKNLEVMLQGDELNDATKREYAVGALLVLCSSTLPEDFGPSLHLNFAGKGKIDDGSARLLNAINHSPEFANIQNGLVDNCRDGQRYLIDRGIGTEAELSVARKQNPEFAARYEHDLAFKLGVDSVVWAKAHDALPALSNQLPPTPATAQIEVRG
jgi:hypothetical protein